MAKPTNFRKIPWLSCWITECNAPEAEHFCLYALAKSPPALDQDCCLETSRLEPKVTDCAVCLLLFRWPLLMARGTNRQLSSDCHWCRQTTTVAAYGEGHWHSIHVPLERLVVHAHPVVGMGDGGESDWGWPPLFPLPIHISSFSSFGDGEPTPFLERGKTCQPPGSSTYAGTSTMPPNILQLLHCTNGPSWRIPLSGDGSGRLWGLSRTVVEVDP